MEAPRLKRILIVEDDEAVRSTLQQLLEAEGYLVFTASNGKQGIEILAMSSEPCLILLDMMMPVMNGQEFLQSIEKKNIIISIPVIVMSAITPFGSVEKYPSVHGCIKKPFDLENLLKIVRKYCEPSEKAA